MPLTVTTDGPTFLTACVMVVSIWVVSTIRVVPWLWLLLVLVLLAGSDSVTGAAEANLAVSTRFIT